MIKRNLLIAIMVKNYLMPMNFSILVLMSMASGSEEIMGQQE